MKPASRRTALAGLGALALVAAAGRQFWTRDRRQGAAEAQALYAVPLNPPDAALNVYHLGHSLVGRDMPAMLAQLAGAAPAADAEGGGGIRPNPRAMVHPRCSRKA